MNNVSLETGDLGHSGPMATTVGFTEAEVNPV